MQQYMSASQQKFSFVKRNLIKMDLLYSCSDLDMKLDQRHPIPNAMVNLETWLPANFQVDDWQVKDLGPLGTGGR